LVLDFHFFGEKTTLDREKVTSHVDDSLTTTTFKNQKICNGRMTNGTTDRLIRSTATEKILRADRFLPPLPWSQKQNGGRDKISRGDWQQPARAFILSFEIIRGQEYV
jgi:hypothetical protein